MKHKESVKTSGALKALGAEGGLEFEQNLTASGEKDHKETNKTGTYTVKKTELLCWRSLYRRWLNAACNF